MDSVLVDTSALYALLNAEDELAANAMLQDVSRTKDLSYFDAVAVAVAERLGVGEVFSFDRHFRLAGLKLASS